MAVKLGENARKTQNATQEVTQPAVVAEIGPADAHPHDPTRKNRVEWP
jgi:hypothetical protein